MKIKEALLFLVALGVAAAFSKPLPVKVDVKPKKTDPAPTPRKPADPEPKYVYKLREPKTVAEDHLRHGFGYDSGQPEVDRSPQDLFDGLRTRLDQQYF